MPGPASTGRRSIPPATATARRRPGPTASRSDRGGPGWLAEAGRGRAFRINREAQQRAAARVSRPHRQPLLLHRAQDAAHPRPAWPCAPARTLRLDCALTHGERLTEADRLAIRRGLGARTLETYSSKEAGQIAHPCERQAGLHVHAESALVEIVDAAGRPVPEGQSGRVIVTPFVSTAQPLIRYEQGDFARFGPSPAAAGAACRCWPASRGAASPSSPIPTAGRRWA
jgi:hypothetical protein